MRKTARLPPIWTMLTLIVLIAIGCSSGDEGLVELTRESAERQIAGERIRDPIIAESIRAVAGLMAAILPLLVCLLLLRGLFHKSDQESLAEVLIEDLVSRQPLLSEPGGVSLPGAGHELRLPAEPAEELQDRS